MRVGMARVANVLLQNDIHLYRFGKAGVFFIHSRFISTGVTGLA